MAPRAGFEPATERLTAVCSTTELPRNIVAGTSYSKSSCGGLVFFSIKSSFFEKHGGGE